VVVDLEKKTRLATFQNITILTLPVTILLTSHMVPILPGRLIAQLQKGMALPSRNIKFNESSTKVSES